MTDDQISAIVALKDALGHAPYNPRYALFPTVEEAKLREGVKRVWRQHGPALRRTWVGWWIEKWERAAQGNEQKAVSKHIRVSGTFASHISERDDAVDSD